MTESNQNTETERPSRATKIGLPPGSLVYLGDHSGEQTIVRAIAYNQQKHAQIENLSLTDFGERDQQLLHWIDYCGLADTEHFHTWGSALGINTMAMEDILSTDQRPKVDAWDERILIIIKMLTVDPITQRINSEQIAMNVDESAVVLFQQRQGDIFEPVRQRIIAGKGRLRQRGSAYLAYCLLDLVVDYYFSVCEFITSRIEDIETDLLVNDATLNHAVVHAVRADLLILKRAAQPMREVIGALQKPDTPMFDETIREYVDDLYDHVLQVIENVDVAKEQINSLIDLENSRLGARLNEVMKFLTIVSTIFIPLSFIAGLYGMNLKMPEAEWEYGYYIVLAGMVSVGIGMVSWLRWKKWL